MAFRLTILLLVQEKRQSRQSLHFAQSARQKNGSIAVCASRGWTKDGGQRSRRQSQHTSARLWVLVLAAVVGLTSVVVSELEAGVVSGTMEGALKLAGKCPGKNVTQTGSGTGATGVVAEGSGVGVVAVGSRVGVVTGSVVAGPGVGVAAGVVAGSVVGVEAAGAGSVVGVVAAWAGVVGESA